MKKCVVTGSFDPITRGHIEVVDAACAAFDCVVVAMFNNEEKQYFFSHSQRVQMCQAALAGKADFCTFDGYVADFCTSRGIDAIVRGVRDLKDFKYEQEIAQFNKKRGNIDTFFVFGSTNISATMTREMINNGNLATLSQYMPDKCASLAVAFLDEKHKGLE